MYHIDYRLYERNLSMIKFLTGVPTVIINKHGSPNILHSVPIPDNYNVTRYPYRISSVTWDISVGGLNCRSTQNNYRNFNIFCLRCLWYCRHLITILFQNQNICARNNLFFTHVFGAIKK